MIPAGVKGVDKIMKKVIVSISAIVVVLLLVFLGFKYEMIDIFTKPPVESNIAKDNGDATKGEAIIEDDTWEPIKEDVMILLNKGESGVYDNLKKDSLGNIMGNSMRYEFKYMDCSISKKKPEGVTINFYKEKEGEKPDSEGNFLNNDEYYYVTVTFEITNKMEENWEVLSISAQNLGIGYFADGEYKRIDEPRGCINSAPEIKGSFKLKRNETATVTNCYILKQSEMEKGKILVKAELMGQKKAIKTPFFVIETKEVIE